MRQPFEPHRAGAPNVTTPTPPPLSAPARVSGITYALGGLAFIPLIGIPFGVTAIVIGLTTRKLGGRLLILLGAGGIALSVILYGSLFYFGFVQRGGVYDHLRSQLAQSSIDALVPQIEFYRLQHGSYPTSLEVLVKAAPKGNLVMAYDPTSVRPRLFYYEKAGEDHYYLRGVGADGQPFTPDDLIPHVEVPTNSKIGLLTGRLP
jgi:hypothetical protein